jgi:uncharacterized membrane protein
MITKMRRFVTIVLGILIWCQAGIAREPEADDCEHEGKPIIGEAPILPSGQNTTFEGVRRTIEKRCAKCHAPRRCAEFLPLTNFDQIRENREYMLYAISNGVMPLNKPGWRYRDEARLLQAWLKEGKDLDSHLAKEER